MPRSTSRVARIGNPTGRAASHAIVEHAQTLTAVIANYRVIPGIFDRAGAHDESVVATQLAADQRARAANELGNRGLHLARLTRPASRDA